MITSPAVQSRRGGLPVWLVGTVALAWGLGIPSRAEEASPEPKTHVLFMGRDFDVQRGKEYHRVTDVSGGSFVLRVKNEIVRVPVNEHVGLRITQVLKLSTVSAEIKEVKAERTYTLASDPRRKWLGEQAMMAGLAADNVQGSSRALGAAQREIESIATFVRRNPDAAASMESVAASAQAQAGAAQRGLDSASPLAGKMSESGDYMQKMEEELKKELFDAVEVSFEISSPRPLTSPYVVVVVQFRDSKAPSHTAQNWIHAEALERLGPQPVKFRVNRGGFPRGYVMERFHVHVYDRGREVASTVAPKRVDLTGEEAHQYLMIEHHAAHKGKDAAAAVAIGNLPADLRQQLPSGDYGRTFYVKVDKEGRAAGVFTDEKCTKALEENYTGSVIRNMRFVPALEKGKPVEGVAKVRMNDINI